jgi:hypothetical protein
MIFFETLKNSIGGLLRLKTQLYWYGGRGWDGSLGRACLILDADDGCRPTSAARLAPASAVASAARTAAVAAPAAHEALATPVLLLIDGLPIWVWVDEQNAEIMNE